MEPTGPKAARWKAWFKKHLDASGKTQRAVADHLGVTESNVSKWMRGTHATDADTAVAVAIFLGGSIPDALRASDHDVLADLVARDGTVDPAVTEILAADLLTDDEKAAMIEIYRRDKDVAADRARQHLKAVIDGRQADLG